MGVAVPFLLFKALNLSHSSHCGTSWHKKHRPKGFSLSQQVWSTNEASSILEAKPRHEWANHLFTAGVLFQRQHLKLKSYTVALLTPTFTQFPLPPPNLLLKDFKLESFLGCRFSRAHKSHKTDTAQVKKTNKPKNIHHFFCVKATHHFACDV